MTVKPNIKKNFNITWLLLYGAGLITVGILVLVNGKIVVEPAARLGGIFIVANGIHRLIRAYARHQRLPVFSGIGNIIIGLISVFFPAATLALLSFIFSLYVFLNALVKFIDFGTALKNAVPDAFYDFFRNILQRRHYYAFRHSYGKSGYACCHRTILHNLRCRRAEAVYP
ncbi:MAG: DUF308 domain-containing protein [[Eubacterium] siraeum]